MKFSKLLKSEQQFYRFFNVTFIVFQDNICFAIYITETSPYSFGNFRKLSLYNYFMPI